jgi:asparagine N-glycosylation enzyme membrane subunit Stt3
MIYHILDIFFTVFHSSLIIFNLLGWILKRTRLLNLITLTLTGSSWLFLGLIVGTLGYCPFTDWHFIVLNRLGKTDLPNSYVKYLIDRITGLDISAILIDKITLYSFIAALTISLILNTRDLRRRRKEIRK